MSCIVLASLMRSMELRVSSGASAGDARRAAACVAGEGCGAGGAAERGRMARSSRLLTERGHALLTTRAVVP